MTGVCEWCGTEFKTYPSKRQRFCSKSCSGFWHAEHQPQPRGPRKDPVACEQCGQLFWTVWTAAGGTRFCSSTCWGRSLAGSGDGKTYPKLNGRHAHRVVAEQMLGRSLRPGEVVHHIDEDKTNHSLSNLRVFPSQAAHAAHHKALKKGLSSWNS